MADLIRRETQKPLYTENGTINTAMHGGFLYILLHLEYSGIYFTTEFICYTHIFCNDKRNKVP